MMRWLMALWCLAGLIFVWLVGPVALGVETEEILLKTQAELVKRYPGARVEIDPQFVIPERIHDVLKIQRLTLLAESGKGTAEFMVYSATETNIQPQSAQLTVKFSAWQEVPIANRRIRPMEALDASAFQSETVDLATGAAHAYRSIILSINSKWEGLEARQTILEGQYPLSTAVQKIPVIRRGQEIPIRLLSNDLVITTTGTADEPGDIGALIHVTAKKTKKQLSGIVSADQVVEVKLRRCGRVWS